MSQKEAAIDIMQDVAQKADNCMSRDNENQRHKRISTSPHCYFARSFYLRQILWGSVYLLVYDLRLLCAELVCYAPTMRKIT